MPKLTWFILLTAVTATILGLVWANNNAYTGIEKIKPAVDNLFKKGNKPDTAAIEKISGDIAGDSYTLVKPGLKTVFAAFVKAWEREGALTQDTINQYRPALDSQFRACQHLKWNQLLAFITDLFIWMLALSLCLFSNILRDIVGDTSKLLGQTYANISQAKGLAAPVVAEPPFSLARVQLLAWITIISSVYVYAVLWDCRDPGSINQTALILMGISGGVFLAGAIIDTTEIQKGIPRSQDQPASGNFFTDILSDASGVSIHRVQNFIWTFVAIIIYFYRYANPPATATDDFLPVLDSTLLALTGISSATYLTMKTRENPAPPQDVIEQLKITLDASNSKTLTAEEIAAVAVSGFPKAVVVLIDKTGTTTTALPDLVRPNFDFIFTKLIPDAYTITVTWTGEPIPGTKKTLTGTWLGQIQKTATAMTIQFA